MYEILKTLRRKSNYIGINGKNIPTGQRFTVFLRRRQISNPIINLTQRSLSPLWNSND